MGGHSRGRLRSGKPQPKPEIAADDPILFTSTTEWSSRQRVMVPLSEWLEGAQAGPRGHELRDAIRDGPDDEIENIVEVTKRIHSHENTFEVGNNVE